MSRRFDAIVIGVGGMGSAAAYHLARRGLRVLGLDRFEIPNEQGSSHGITRAIRLAYAEDPAYVPLLARAYEGWRELEAEVGEQLLHITGSMDISRPDQAIVQGAIRSCEEHGLPYELLDAGEVARRFPGYRLDPEMVALLQPDGGFVLPERAIAAHARGALASGAELRPGERVTGWEPTAEGVRVSTDLASYEAERLVITAGAWIGELAGVPVVAERQVLAWLQPRQPQLFTPTGSPSSICRPPMTTGTTGCRSSASRASSSVATTTFGSAGPPTSSIARRAQTTSRCCARSPSVTSRRGLDPR